MFHHVLKITYDSQVSLTQGEHIIKNCVCIFMNTVFLKCSQQSIVQKRDVQPKTKDYVNDILYKINSISF
jgi:hypothetical protein